MGITKIKQRFHEEKKKNLSWTGYLVIPTSFVTFFLPSQRENTTKKPKTTNIQPQDAMFEATTK